MSNKISIVVLSAFLTALLATGSAFAASGSGYFIHADIVRSAEGNPRGPGCVPNSVFYPGEGVVFRAKVYDKATGQEITQEDVMARGMELVATVGDGQTYSMHLIPHPNPQTGKEDEYWTAFWLITEDDPAGILTWTVSAKDDEGRTGEFAPIGQQTGIPNLMIMPANAAPGGASQG